MAEVLTDERIARVLRPFVRAAVPVLQILRESDPLRLRRLRGEPENGTDLLGAGSGSAGESLGGRSAGGRGTGEPGRPAKLRNRLDSMRLPGSSAWDAMTLEQRCDWWAKRVGRFLALLAALPNFGGVLTSRLPVRNALGTLGQALVLSAIAAEHGVHDRAHQVRLIATVVLDRDLPRAVAEGAGGSARIRDDERIAELTEDLEESHRRYGRPRTQAVAGTVWRMARLLWEIDSELDRRPQGRLHHEALGSLPVVGVVGGYLGERSALRRVTRRGTRWLRRNPPPRE